MQLHLVDQDNGLRMERLVQVRIALRHPPGENRPQVPRRRAGQSLNWSNSSRSVRPSTQLPRQPRNVAVERRCGARRRRQALTRSHRETADRSRWRKSKSRCLFCSRNSRSSFARNQRKRCQKLARSRECPIQCRVTQRISIFLGIWIIFLGGLLRSQILTFTGITKMSLNPVYNGSVRVVEDDDGQCHWLPRRHRHEQYSPSSPLQ